MNFLSFLLAIQHSFEEMSFNLSLFWIFMYVSFFCYVAGTTMNIFLPNAFFLPPFESVHKDKFPGVVLFCQAT